MVEFIENEEVKENLEMSELIGTIREAFKSYYRGESKMPEKSYLKVPKGDFRSMPALVSLDEYEKAGVKWVNVHPENKEYPTVMASVILCDPETGNQEYFIEADELTAMRTGAASGVATDALAPKDASSVGLIGAGKQAYKQLEAIMCVRDIDKVVINDIDKELAEKFVEENPNSEFGSKEEACSCDVLCTITPSTVPIVSQNNLNDDKPYHINAIGADSDEKQEFEKSIMLESKVVVDDIKQASHSGEISKSISSNLMSEEDIYYTLGELLCSEELNERERKQRTVYDSTGIAIQDISTCRHII